MTDATNSKILEENLREAEYLSRALWMVMVGVTEKATRTVHDNDDLIGDLPACEEVRDRTEAANRQCTKRSAAHDRPLPTPPFRNCGSAYSAFASRGGPCALAAPSPTSPNGSCPRICGIGCEGLGFRNSPVLISSLPAQNAPTVDVTAGRFCVFWILLRRFADASTPLRRARSRLWRPFSCLPQSTPSDA